MKSTLTFGLHAVNALLQEHPEDIIELHVFEARKDKRLQGLIDRARKLHIHILSADKAQLDRLSEGEKHQGVVARAKAIHCPSDLKTFLAQCPDNPLLLILDCVQDPHNLGACLRTADAAGVSAVIVPKDKSAPLTPVAKKIASGAAETVPLITVTNLANALEQIKEKGIWLVGTCGDAKQSLYEASFTGGIGIVMGTEGTGLRPLTAKHCDFLVNIPMLGAVESLNVSVATGICLYEALRQRR